MGRAHGTKRHAMGLNGKGDKAKAKHRQLIQHRASMPLYRRPLLKSSGDARTLDREKSDRRLLGRRHRACLQHPQENGAQEDRRGRAWAWSAANISSSCWMDSLDTTLLS